MKLRENSRRILERIIEANNRHQTRGIILSQLREDLEKFKVLVRLCHESGGFANTNAYFYVSEQIVNLSKPPT